MDYFLKLHPGWQVRCQYFWRSRNVTLLIKLNPQIELFKQRISLFPAFLYPFVWVCRWVVLDFAEGLDYFLWELWRDRKSFVVDFEEDFVLLSEEEDLVLGVLTNWNVLVDQVLIVMNIDEIIFHIVIIFHQCFLLPRKRVRTIIVKILLFEYLLVLVSSLFLSLPVLCWLLIVLVLIEVRRSLFLTSLLFIFAHLLENILISIWVHFDVRLAFRCFIVRGFEAPRETAADSSESWLWLLRRLFVFRGRSGWWCHYEM